MLIVRTPPWPTKICSELRPATLMIPYAYPPGPPGYIWPSALEPPPAPPHMTANKDVKPAGTVKVCTAPVYVKVLTVRVPQMVFVEPEHPPMGLWLAPHAEHCVHTRSAFEVQLVEM